MTYPDNPLDAIGSDGAFQIGGGFGQDMTEQGINSLVNVPDLNIADPIETLSQYLNKVPVDLLKKFSALFDEDVQDNFETALGAITLITGSLQPALRDSFPKLLSAFGKFITGTASWDDVMAAYNVITDTIVDINIESGVFWGQLTAILVSPWVSPAFADSLGDMIGVYFRRTQDKATQAELETAIDNVLATDPDSEFWKGLLGSTRFVYRLGDLVDVFFKFGAGTKTQADLTASFNSVLDLVGLSSPMPVKDFTQQLATKWISDMFAPSDFVGDIRKSINQMIEGLHIGYFDANFVWIPSVTTPPAALPSTGAPTMTAGSNDEYSPGISSSAEATIPAKPTGIIAIPNWDLTVSDFPAGTITYAFAAVKDGIEGPAAMVSVFAGTLSPPNTNGRVDAAWTVEPGATTKIYRRVNDTYQATDWRLIASPATAGTLLSPWKDKTPRSGGTVAHPKTDAELAAQLVNNAKQAADQAAADADSKSTAAKNAAVAEAAIDASDKAAAAQNAAVATASADAQAKANAALTDAKADATAKANAAELAATAVAQEAKDGVQDTLNAVAVGATGDSSLVDVDPNTAKGSVDGLRLTVQETSDAVAEIVEKLNGKPQSAGLVPTPLSKGSSAAPEAWGSEWTFYPTPAGVTGRSNPSDGWFMGAGAGASSQAMGTINAQLLNSDSNVPTRWAISAGVANLPSSMFGETNNSALVFGGGVTNTLGSYRLYARLFGSKLEIGYCTGFTRTVLATQTMTTGANSQLTLAMQPGTTSGKWKVTALTAPNRGVQVDNATLPFTPGAFFGIGMTGGTSGSPPNIRYVSAYTYETTVLPGVAGRFLSTGTMAFPTSSIGIIKWNIPSSDSQFKSVTGAGSVANGGIEFQQSGLYTVTMQVPFDAGPDNDTTVAARWYLNGALSADYEEQQGSYSLSSKRARFQWNYLIPAGAGMVLSMGIKTNKALNCAGGAVLTIARAGIL